MKPNLQEGTHYMLVNETVMKFFKDKYDFDEANAPF
jgi:hypothetical protein